MSESKRKGRPTKPPAPGARVSLGLKVTPRMKRLIDDEAKRSGRTQSQVAELWLEQFELLERWSRVLAEPEGELQSAFNGVRFATSLLAEARKVAKARAKQ
jgi:hypothetical protein